MNIEQPHAQPAPVALRDADSACHRAVAPNAWRPLIVRGAGLALGIVCLSLVGLAATETGTNAQAARSTEAAINSSWLAPDRVSPAPRGNKKAQQGKPPQSSPPTPHATTAPASPDMPSDTPGKNEQPVPPPPVSGIDAEGRVVLNIASVEELTRLPGIGTKRARKIVALRTRLKRFKKATDLLRIRGIGVKSLRKMLPHLVLDPPSET